MKLLVAAVLVQLISGLVVWFDLRTTAVEPMFHAKEQVDNTRNKRSVIPAEKSKPAKSLQSQLG